LSAESGWLVYDSSVRRFAALIVFVAFLAGVATRAQEEGGPHKADSAKTEPKYTDTFSGTIVELSAVQTTVSRSILGKPAERHTFLIKSDTVVEGKLRIKSKVTVGFVMTDDGDVARLIVVRTAQRPAQDKK
jgi:hypothetical protein